MPAEIRVRICARDAELREWLADELALLSPTIDVQTADGLDDLAAAPAELLIVGVDALSDSESEQLRTILERQRGPVIAIGTPSSVLRPEVFTYVLDARLTSKQLKRAVRDCIARPAAAARRDA